MHIRPYADQFNNNVAHVFSVTSRNFPEYSSVLPPTNTIVFEENLFEDGIMYYMSDCMKNRNYYIFTITPDGYEREVVYF